MIACTSGCTIRGEHLADCDGTAVRRDGETVECRGCLPRPAEVGVLCSWCWGRLQSTTRTLPALVEHLELVASPSIQSPSGHTSEGGGCSRPSEGMLYPAATVEVDDLHSMLATWCAEVADERSLPHHMALTRWAPGDGWEALGPSGPGATRRLVSWLDPHLEWVASQPWAGDFLAELLAASRRAESRFPVEERARRSDVRCPACGCRSLIVSPPPAPGADVVVTCELPACGLVLAEADWEHARALAVAVEQARAARAEREPAA